MVVTTVVGGVVCAALVGVGVAAALWGGGWVWPATARDISSAVVGLVGGAPAAGYPPGLHARVAGPVPTYLLVALSELLLCVGCLLGARLLRHRLGLGGQKTGFATRAQARRALGTGALRAARPVIRPDLTRR